MHENKKLSISLILNSFFISDKLFSLPEKFPLSINFSESPKVFSLFSPLTESKIESPKYSL